MVFDDLAKYAKDERASVKKATYQEKVTGEFAPYIIVKSYPKIEQLIWDDSCSSVARRSICASLRHRYCLLHLTSGILRCESLYRAELSDFIERRPPSGETVTECIALGV